MTEGCRRSRRWIVGFAAFALLGLASASLPLGAGAITTPKRCGQIQAKGKAFAVRGHLTRCSFARPAARGFLRHGIKPRGWSCVRYPPRQTSIAFTCRRGRKDIYAIRR